MLIGCGSGLDTLPCWATCSSVPLMLVTSKLPACRTFSRLEAKAGKSYLGGKASRIILALSPSLLPLPVELPPITLVVAESKVAPMGPFFLTDLLGLDTVLHVAEHLRESYGDRFFVHKQMQDLVTAGNLGAKTGKGFYEHGS